MNKNNKIRNTFIIAAAATVFTASNTINAFVPPSSSVDQCKVVSTVFETPNNYNAQHEILTSLSSHNAQHDSLADISCEGEILSEFLGRSLIPLDGSTSRGDHEFPLLMAMSEQQREYELNLGKAVDTLRKDYPKMLTETPDFTIYDPHIEVVDPKGIKIHSLKSYKTSFNFLHMLVKFFYCKENSLLTFRLAYDCARKNIRVSWNAILIPRSIYGGVRNRLHVDGISVYELDRESGLINQHRVEHLLINDAPVEAPQGIFRAIAKEAMYGLQGPESEGVPVWNLEHGGASTVHHNVLEFRSNNGLKNTVSLFDDNNDDYDGAGDRQSTSSLFTSSSLYTSSTLFSSADAASDGDFQHPLFDQEAFDRKNASRKKFGVPPLTPDEYVQIQAEVKAMEVEVAQRQKSAQAAEMAKPKDKGNFLSKMFGDVLKNTCETNYDCERPEVCCDLGFKKMCCSSGMKVFDMPPMGGRLERIPVRVVADDHTYPRGGPDGMDDYY